MIIFRVYDYTLRTAHASVSSDMCIFEGHDAPGGQERMWMAIMDLSTDLVFCFDIFAQFHTAVWELVPGTAQHWEFFDDLSTVRWRYFRGDFKWDALGQIPWQYFDCIFAGFPKQLKVLRLLRLIKLFRLQRLSKRIKQLEEWHGGIFRVAVILAKLLVILFMSAHWLCCLWFWAGFPEGWVVVEGMVDGEGTLTVDMYTAWIAAFYWSITTMTTIGYGDISAGTASERLLAVFAMCLGCALFAWTTGQITHTLTSSSQCSTRFRERLLEIEEFFCSRGVSMELRDQIMAFYQLKFPSERIFDEPAIMNALPRELRRKLMLELFDDMMQLAPIFAACDVETQRELCYRLRSYNTTEGIQITCEGEVPTHLYVVRLGSVQVTRKEEDLAVVSRGDLFGENALLGWSCDGKRNRSSWALTMCDLCVLTKDDVAHLLEHDKTFYWAVRKIVDAHSARLRSLSVSGEPVAHSDIYMINWQEHGQKFREEENRVRGWGNSSVNKILELEKNGGTQSEAQSGWEWGDMGKTFGDTIKALGGMVQKDPVQDARHRLLCTRMRIMILSLKAQVKQDFEVGQTVAFVVQWKGIEGIPETEDRRESKIEALMFDEEGNAVFTVSVDLTVYHENNRWHDLGEADIMIVDYGIDSAVAFQANRNASPVMQQEEAFSKIAAKSKQLERSKSMSTIGFGGGTPRKATPRGDAVMSPRDQSKSSGAVLWKGRVPLSELVSNRILDTKTKKSSPKIELAMLAANGSHINQCTLTVAVRIKRMLRNDSSWKRLLSKIRDVPLSQFFQKQQRRIMSDLHARFHDKMDVMLLERFRSMGLTTLMKSGKQAATDSELDKMSEARTPVATCPADAIGVDKNLLAELKNNMAIMLHDQHLSRKEVESMRSELEPLRKSSAASHSALQELAALREDMRELARAQGAIMAVLQEQREHQVQMLNTTFNRVQGSGGGSQSSYAQQKQPVTVSAKSPRAAHVSMQPSSRTVPDVMTDFGGRPNGPVGGGERGIAWISGPRKSPRGRPPTLGEADYDHSDAEGTPSATPTNLQQGNDNVMGIAIGDAVAVMPRATGARVHPKEGQGDEVALHTSYSKRSVAPISSISPRSATPTDLLDEPVGFTVQVPVSNTSSPTRPHNVPRLPLTGSAWRQRQDELDGGENAFEDGSREHRSSRPKAQFVSEGDASAPTSARGAYPRPNSGMSTFGAGSRFYDSASSSLQGAVRPGHVGSTSSSKLAQELAARAAGQNRGRHRNSSLSASPRNAPQHGEGVMEPIETTVRSVAETRGIWERVSSGVQALLSPRSQAAFQEGRLSEMPSPMGVRQVSDDDDSSLYGDI